MAKRFTSTEIWNEDWFLDMPNEYKLFWFFMLSNCDHAGILKINPKSFKRKLDVEICMDEAIKYFNEGKQRVRVLSDSAWLIEDFFIFQYGQKFNRKNRVHLSIEDVYLKVGVKLGSIRGLIEVM